MKNSFSQFARTPYKVKLLFLTVKSQIHCLVHLTEKRRPSNIKKNVQKITLKNIRKFTEVHLVIVRDFRILKKNFILKILRCTEIPFKNWFEASFCEVFFDYCSSTAAFSKLFSVVEVWASLQKLSQLKSKDDWETINGTILLYSRNLSNILAKSAKHQKLRSIWRKK